MVELGPVEDLLLAILRDVFEPDIPVNTLLAVDQSFPSILMRSTGDRGQWAGDERFLDAAEVRVQVLCEGVDADEEAALLSEAIRVALRDSRNKVMPGLGHITKIELTHRPQRQQDWATATGPVQYADLPNNVQRYESIYFVEIKRPVGTPATTPPQP